MKKHLTFACFALLLAAFLAVGVAAFTDTKDSDYESYINRLYDYKLVVGVSETEFGVNQTVTRQQMALFIARVVLGRTVVEPSDYTTKHPFTDITDSTYDAAISFCYENKIIAGRTKNTFDPFGQVTGQEALAMAIRALGYNDLSYPDGYIKFGYDNWMPKELYEAPTAPATRGVIAGLMYDTLTTPCKNTRATYEDKNFTALEDMLYQQAWSIWNLATDEPQKPYQIAYFDDAPNPVAAANFALMYGCVSPIAKEGDRRNGEPIDKAIKYTKNGYHYSETISCTYIETYAIADINKVLMRMFNNPVLLSAAESYYWESLYHVTFCSDGNGNICRYVKFGGMGGIPSGEQKNVSVTPVDDSTYDVCIQYISNNYVLVDGEYQKDGQIRTTTYNCRVQILDPTQCASIDNIKYLSFKCTGTEFSPAAAE